MNSQTGAHAGIPAEHLYWCLLTTEGRILGPTGQDFRFERVLPVAVESLHIVRATCPIGVVLVGIEPDRLRAFLSQAGLTPNVWQLLPERIPPHIGDRLGGMAEDMRVRLNLLQGPFEPQPRRRQRLGTLVALQVMGVFAVVALVVGTERRVAHQAEAIQGWWPQQQEMVATVIEPEPGNPLPPQVRLLAEVRRLEQVASPAVGGPDTAAVLEAVWRRWPKELRVQVEGFSVDRGRVSVRGRVPTLADAERLAASLAEIEAGPHRLRAEPLQAQQTPEGATFVLSITATAPAVRNTP